METKQLKPLLAAHYATTARDVKKKWETLKKEIQDVIDIFNNMKLPVLENTEQLIRLFNDTDNFIFDLQTGGGAIIRGTHGEHIAVNKDKAKEFFVKPEGYAEMLVNVRELKEKCNYPLIAIKDDFVYVDGALGFTEKRQAAIDDAGNCYARTEKGQRYARFWAKVAAAFFEEGMDSHQQADGNRVKLDLVLFSHGPEIIHGFDKETKKPIYNIRDSGVSVPNPTFPGDRF